MKKRYVFDLRLGQEQIMEVVDLPQTLTPEAIKIIYEEWRDKYLTGGWWPDEVETRVKVLNLVNYEDKIESEAEADE